MSFGDSFRKVRPNTRPQPNLKRIPNKEGPVMTEITTKPKSKRERGDSRTADRIRFSATLLSPLLPAVSKTRRGEAGRPAASARKAVSWTFLNLPKEASAKLPSRGQTTVEGTLDGFPFRATLEPDGRGGHWL